MRTDSVVVVVLEICESDVRRGCDSSVQSVMQMGVVDRGVRRGGQVIELND